MEIERILKEIKELYSGGPVSEARIQEAEEELGAKFAPDYRKYLEMYGCISFDGHEMTGITAVPRLNVVKATKENRVYEPAVPKDFYVIEETEMDGIIIWQSGEGKIYSTIPRHQPELLCDSLAEYYLRCHRLSEKGVN